MIRNIFTNFSARLGVAVINFVMLLITTHVLGKSVRGDIAITQLSINIIHMVAELAGGPSLIYLVPRTRLGKLLFTGTAWSIFSTMAVGFTFLYLNNLLPIQVIPSSYFKEILIISFLISVHTLNINALLGQKRILLFNVLYFAQGIIQLITLILCIFVFKLGDAWPFLYASIAGYGTCYIAGLILVTRNAPQPHISEKQPILMLLFRNGFFTQAASIVFMLSIRWSYYQLESSIPGSKEDKNGAVGSYSTALSLGEAILIFATSVAAITLSHVANLADPKAGRAIVLRLSKVSLVVTALACIFFSLLPPAFYQWLIGKTFGDIPAIFQTIAPGIILISFGTVYGHYFSGTGKHYLNFISGACALLAIALAVSPLIAHYGTTGAGWTASIAYGTTAIVIFGIFMSLGPGGEWKTLLPSKEDFLFIKNFLTKNPVEKSPKSEVRNSKSDL